MRRGAVPGAVGTASPGGSMDAMAKWGQAPPAMPAEPAPQDLALQGGATERSVDSSGTVKGKGGLPSEPLPRPRTLARIRFRRA